MKGPDGNYGMWDYIKNPPDIAKPSTKNNKKDNLLKQLPAFFRKGDVEEPETDSNLPSQRRLTGRLRFAKTKTSDENLNQDRPLLVDDQDEVGCSKQFKDYCASTSLHGYRYISEPKRTYAERYVV